MRILKYAVAIVLVFCMLAVTIVCSALANDQTDDLVAMTGNISSDENIEPYTDIDIADEGAGGYAPRMTAPDKSNKYYYSDMNIFYKYGYGMPNCTCYAYGRAYELLKTEPKLCIYDAEQWYDYNKKYGYYSYGQTPKLGAIACWKYTNYYGGHVAVVEKITQDTVYYSNSAWSGANFYVDSLPIDDPVKGRPGWEFLGYIYIGDFEDSSDEPQGDVYRITSDDGVNIRSGAGTSYAWVSAIPYGATVTVTKTAKADGYTWGYTNYMGIDGWFVTDFAQLVYDDENTGSSDEEVTHVSGDVDLDGEMTVLDAAWIQMSLVRTKTLTEEQKAIADVDKDGTVSVIDSTKICRVLAGLE